MVISIKSLVVIGIIKEFLWDKLLKQGTPEVKDALYVFAGALMAMILTMQYN